MKVVLIGLLGYGAALLGFIPGTLFSAIASGLSRKFRGILLGFTAGLLIAFVCFEILPVAFEGQGLVIGTCGIMAGVALTAWLEGKLNGLNFDTIAGANSGLNKAKTNYIKMGMLTGMSVMLHKIPEGMAIGSMLAYDFRAGISFALIIAIHCFPEAIAVSVPLKQGGFSTGKIMLACMAVCAPMGIGSVIGALMFNISEIFISLCMALSGGIMLYITCGEMLPECKDIWRGRLTTVCACMGFLTGIILTAKI